MGSFKKFMFKKLFCIPVINSLGRLAFGKTYWVRPIDFLFVVLFIVFSYLFEYYFVPSYS